MVGKKTNISIFIDLHADLFIPPKIEMELI